MLRQLNMTSLKFNDKLKAHWKERLLKIAQCIITSLILLLNQQSFCSQPKRNIKKKYSWSPFWIANGSLRNRKWRYGWRHNQISWGCFRPSEVYGRQLKLKNYCLFIKLGSFLKKEPGLHFLSHSEFEKKIGSYIMGDGRNFVFLCIFLKGLGNLMLHKLFRLMQLVSCQQNLMWPLSNVH